MKEKGFIKKVITLYVDTTIADNWKNRDLKWIETKDGYIVEQEDTIKEK